MRRIKQTQLSAPGAAAPAGNLSIESMTIDQVLHGRRVLSVEEESAALEEADALQQEVDQGVAETARVEDVTDVMLNVADSVSEVKDLTPDQAKLIDTTSEMAVAGTDGDPDDVIPSVEPLIGKDMTVESFVDDVRKRAAEIWARIRAFCAQIWASIVQFFQRIFASAPRLLARVKELRDIAGSKKKGNANGTKKSDVVAVLVGGNSISYPGYMTKNAKELKKGLEELDKLAGYAYGTFLKDCKLQADTVAAELKKFDPKKAAEALNNVVKKVPGNNFPTLPPNPPTGYLGCFDVHATRVDSSKIKGLSDSQISNALRNSRVYIQARAGAQGMINTKSGFVTMSFEEINQILTAVETLAKKMLAHETSADSKAIETARAALLEGGNHASAEIAKVNGTDDAGRAEREFAVDVMRGLANFNTTLTRWVSDLPMPVSKKLYQTCRTSLVLVEKSLAQY